jgi:integral membrane sensor domain MASE1
VKPVQSLAVAALVTLAYVAGGKLGLALAYPNPSASAIWPPTGIALAAVLVLGYRIWPAILLGAWFVNFTTSGNPITSLSIAGGNTVEALLAGYLVNRFAGGRQAFDSPVTVFKFALLAAVCATSVSAIVGSLSLLISGSATWSELETVLMT